MSIKKVTITINMGNDAMQTEDDIANPLGDLARRIELRGLGNPTLVKDGNGNNVGTVEVEWS